MNSSLVFVSCPCYDITFCFLLFPIPNIQSFSQISYFLLDEFWNELWLNYKLISKYNSAVHGETYLHPLELRNSLCISLIHQYKLTLNLVSLVFRGESKQITYFLYVDSKYYSFFSIDFLQLFNC